MRKLVAAAAVWILLGTAGSASAASTVSLNLQLESGSGPTAVYGLYVANSLGIGIGAVDVLVEGATGFGFDATNLGISLADSVYLVTPIPGQPWDALVVNNVFTTPPTAIAPPGATTRLGAFLPGDLPYLLPGETPDPSGPGTVFAATIFDAGLSPIKVIQIEHVGGGLILTVPEPAAAPLAVSLLCLACAVAVRSRSL
jgi:hypothetical protein